MKIRGPKSLLLAGASLLVAATSASAVVNLVGITVPWIQGAPTGRNSNGDTIGGNSEWNVYLRPVGGAFLNSGNGSSTRINFALEVGKTYNFEAVLHDTSWVDNSPPKPGSYLNLYFNGNLGNPGISGKLAGGNTGALSALTAADIPNIKNDLDGSLVAPAGSLSFLSGSERVTLSSLTMLSGAEAVGAFDNLPVGSGDSILRFTLGVVPEPSSSLLALIGMGLAFFRRRR